VVAVSRLVRENLSMNETVPGRFSVILKWLFCTFIISLPVLE
jgi:hypothetical protein